MVKAARRLARANKKRKFDEEQALEKLGDDLHNEQRGVHATLLDDDALFTVDSRPDWSQGPISQAPRKRPRASKGKLLTTAQKILSACTDAKPFCKAFHHKKAGATKHPEKHLARQPIVRQAAAPVFDLWQQEDGTAPSTEEAWCHQKSISGSSADPTLHRRSKRAAPGQQQGGGQSAVEIAAVEVDPAGCSINPDREHHQQAMAQAVADEYQRELDAALRPKAPPATVFCNDINPGEMVAGLFSESDDDSTSTACDQDLLESAGCGALGAQHLKLERRKTAKERERQAVQRAQQVEAAARKEERRQRHLLNRLPAVQKELDKVEEVQQYRRARREADRHERQLSLPPRLGKHRYTPMKLQVLPTEELTGSLRSLKTLPVVAKDRFNSIQKRGLVPVTVRVPPKKRSSRNVKEYMKKDTEDASRETHKKIAALKSARLKAARGKQS